MTDNIGLMVKRAMGLSMYDEFGSPWDFNCDVMWSIAKNVEKHLAFSRLRTLGHERFDEQNVKDILGQRRSGLYFLCEHPSGASSWSSASFQRLRRQPGNHRLLCTRGTCANMA
eukprot:9085157-Pyramimonas_sp.AAC.1